MINSLASKHVRNVRHPSDAPSKFGCMHTEENTVQCSRRTEPWTMRGREVESRCRHV